ncbi:DUF1289 domain-containing protein [Hahella sp. CCB-MM4]|uniref:DUF1289 domain-containing protein n=1 Tax=Hahella sp. (strain CCB-MM4) TaxID=1926491 RepID=UPI000B9BCBA4|nr:DUF1289 domain-containing protein [Hahella sp. CCB-MM4]OZG72495.1 DUF1289 domain-containing protein [Hahella sp. CCB-MM4]
MKDHLKTRPTSDLNPCIRNCCLDQHDVCCGCKRTLEEILAWHSMNQEQKEALLEELKKRQESGN